MVLPFPLIFDTDSIILLSGLKVKTNLKEKSTLSCFPTGGKEEENEVVLEEQPRPAQAADSNLGETDREGQRRTGRTGRSTSR